MSFPFSTGELINFLMVGVMILTLLYTRRRHTTEDQENNRKELNVHLLDCAKKNGEVETTLKIIQRDMKRIERKVDYVSAEIRNNALGVANKFITTFPSLEEEEEDI